MSPRGSGRRNLAITILVATSVLIGVAIWWRLAIDVQFPLCATSKEAEDQQRRQNTAVEEAREWLHGFRGMESFELEPGTADVQVVLLSPSVGHAIEKITDPHVAAMVKMLGEKFAAAKVPISFKLAGVSRAAGQVFSQGMLNQVRSEHGTGVPTTLTLTVCDIKGIGLYGDATFPNSAGKKSDGVLIDYRVFGTGLEKGYETGGLLIHEVGHWLGLLHPFGERRCADNDGLSDTGKANGPCRILNACPRLDNCSGDNGLPDPTSNYMDYTGDSCRIEFTPKQVELMLSCWRLMRRRIVTQDLNTLGLQLKLRYPVSISDPVH